MPATHRFDHIDWEVIREAYVAGQLSVKEIARRHGCSDTAINKKARELGWKRHLSDRVRDQVREKLVRGQVCSSNTGANQQKTDDQIIDEASDIGVHISLLQRDDIRRLRSLEQRFLAELGDKDNPPKKAHVSAFQGDVTVTTLLVTSPEKCAALQALANVQHKRIQLERQAYNLDDEGAQKKQATLAEILAEIDGQARTLPGDSGQ
jgi:hypothetical protein